MNKLLIVLAATATLASAPAMAQKMGGAPKAGTTRDQALNAAARAFGKMDANSDGVVDAAEATSVLQARAEKRGKTFKAKAATRFISRNDGNSDGKVTLDEYKAAAGTAFDAADANKNGVIDPEEAPAAAAAPAAGGDAAKSDGGDDE